MDRQPLTDRLGDRLLAEYGGAAAAYSLRALNGNGDNVVRVRRASDNDEKDFTAEQIELGEMVNWVNSQTVPPLDIGVETSEGRIPVPEGGTSIGTPAAAYSLRNLSTTYTGNVVDVRRSSDDAEASFTAAEVSDGTLENWVAEEQVGWNVQPTWDVASGDGVISSQSSTATTSTFSITTTSGVSFVRQNSKPNHVIASSGDQVIANITLSGFDVDVLARLQTAGTNTIVAQQTLSNGTADYTFNLTGSGGYFSLTLIEATSGATLTFNSIKVIGKSGHVSKWYDQSGNNNHAVQTTAASQPKIVDAGVLVTGDNGKTAIKFDGVDDSLNCGARVVELSQNPATVFAVSQKDGGTGENLGYTCSEGDAVSPYSSNFIFGSDNGGSVLWVNATNFGVGGDGPRLESFEWDQVNFQAYVNGAASGAAGGATVNIETSNTIIGAAGDQLRAFSARKITELISYKSDQSANRRAIEANIGETYGISGIPAYDNTVDGFVETWYDQSVNGNDATQSVAASQPKIVDAGVLLNEIKFDGADDVLNFTEIDFSTNSWMLSAVVDWDGSISPIVGGSTSQWSLHVTASNNFSSRATSDSTIHNFIPTSSIATGDGLFTVQRSSDVLSGYYDGVFADAAPAITAASEFKADKIGLRGSFYGSSGVKEIIIYDSDQSANRAAIEANINNHYSIYA